MTGKARKDEMGMEKYAVVQNPKEKEAADKARSDIKKAEKRKKR